MRLCEENKQIPLTNHVSAADSLHRTSRIFQLCCRASGVACGGWWQHGHRALLWLIKSMVDYSHNFMFRLHLQRPSPPAIAAIFKQPQETDLSVSAGECALQSSKLHIWVTHCMVWGNCVQFSQELDSYQMVVLGGRKKESSNSREGVIFGIKMTIC